MDLALDKYTEKGLYLVFPDSTSLELTRSNIERLAAQYWDDPASIPPDVKTSAEIKRCDISPVKEKPGLCDALRPVLPFLKEVDKYISFDKVTAIYKGDKKEDLYVSETTMQEALKYVSILSLMYYCQVGRQYWKYFHGIIPFMSPKEIALRIYLNMYWFHKGDKEAINKL